METKLGRITHVRMGYGGYQDAMFGISFQLGGDGWGTGDFWGHWAMKPTEHHKWTEADQRESLGKMSLRVVQLLRDAKKQDIQDLKDVPVEVTFDGMTLSSWRILTEVV